MICPVCGKEIADGLAVCPICGVALTAPQAPVSTAAPQDAAPQNAAPQYAPQQNAAPQYAPQQYTAPQQFAAPQSPAVMPKNAKQFIKQMSQNPEYKKIGGGITVSALVFYLSAALTMALATLGGNSGAGVLDAVILVGFGLWIQFGYSRVASVIATVYSIANMIYMTVETGKLSGYLIVVGAVLAIIYTFKAASEFKKYKESVTAIPPQQ